MNRRIPILVACAAAALVTWLFLRPGESARQGGVAVVGVEPALEPITPPTAPPPKHVEPIDPVGPTDSLADRASPSGAPTPQAMAGQVVAALVLEDARSLGGLFVTPWDVLPERFSDALASGATQGATSATWSWSQAENFSRVLGTADGRTARIQGVSVVSIEGRSRDLQVQLTLEGDQATLTVSDVIHVSAGWVTVNMQPLRLRWTRHPGVTIR